MAKLLCEIEIDEACNRNHKFAPLARVLRGRFVWTRNREPGLLQLAQRFGFQDIPGQRLRLFDDGTALLVDPLVTDPGLRELREQLAKKWKLPEAEEAFTLDADALATWFYWCRMAVEAHIARVVEGNFDAKLPGAVKKFFYSNPDQRDPRDQTIERLVAALAECLLTSAKSKLAAVLGGA